MEKLRPCDKDFFIFSFSNTPSYIEVYMILDTANVLLSGINVFALKWDKNGLEELYCVVHNNTL